MTTDAAVTYPRWGALTPARARIHDKSMSAFVIPRFFHDPTITFLNHGSFGSTPQPLLEAQNALRAQMEAEPVRFMMRELPALLNEARQAAATFLGGDPAELAFVTNATTGVNAVLASFPDLGPGDELLTTSHVYGAVWQTLRHKARQTGCSLVMAPIPLPIANPGRIIDAVVGAMGPRTRLLVLDQITSPTAMVWPVEPILEAARARGIPVLLDGAHAPGHIPVDLGALRPDFWVGNLHKWLCAPKGCAVLHVDRRHQGWLHSPSISHLYEGGLHAEFDWPGTFDPTAWLCAPAAIALHEAMGGAHLRAAHFALARQGAEIVAEAVGTALPIGHDSLVGAMALISLPADPALAPRIKDALLDQHHIEVPIIAWDGHLFVRISAFSAYNRVEHYQHLAAALPQVLAAL